MGALQVLWYSLYDETIVLAHYSFEYIHCSFKDKHSKNNTNFQCTAGFHLEIRPPLGF